MVLDIPIIPVATVDGLAYNLYKSDNIICPLMDARRIKYIQGYTSGLMVSLKCY